MLFSRASLGGPAITLGVLVVLLGLSEAVFRAAGYHGTTIDFWPTEYSKRYGWALKKSYSAVWEDLEWKIPYSTNTLGFRGPEFSQTGSDKKHLVILGDSVAEGWGVPYEKSFVHLTAQGLDWRVFNLGVRAYDILQEYRVFVDKGLAFRPDAVVQVLNQNDVSSGLREIIGSEVRYKPRYRIVEQTLQFDEVSEEPPMRLVNEGFGLGAVKRLLYRSAFVSWVRKQMLRSDRLDRALDWIHLRRRDRRSIIQEVNRVDAYVAGYAEAASAAFGSMSLLAKTHGFQYVVVWLGDQPAPQDLQDSIRRHHIDYVDVRLDASQNFKFDSHPNVKGHEHLAQRIIEHFSQQKRRRSGE